jgi:opacity protein-like surface antigen
LIQKGVTLGGLCFFKRKNLQKTCLYVRTGLTIANAVSRITEESFDINSSIAAGFDVGLGLRIKSLDGWSLLSELRYSEASYGYDQHSNSDRLGVNNIA